MTHEELKNYIINAALVGNTVNPAEFYAEHDIPSTTSTIIRSYYDRVLTDSICIDGIYVRLNSTGETELVYYAGEYSELDLGDTIDVIRPYAFYLNNTIRSIFGCRINKIDKGAFMHSSLVEADFSCKKSAWHSENGVIVKEKAFYNCRNLKKVRISNCIHIETLAFAYCYFLHGLYIPNDTYIDKKAFLDCWHINDKFKKYG